MSLARLRGRAWLVFAAMLVPLIPGVVAAAISAWLPESAHPVVALCRTSWWAALLAGAVLSMLVNIAAPWLFRCPSCRYRLPRAGYGFRELVVPGSSGLRFCPHCGVALAKMEPRE